MRKYTISLIAIAIAILMSSFEKRNVTVYMIYDGIGPQNWLSSYDQSSSDPGWIVGTTVLAWFSMPDDDGTVWNAEFQYAFETLDVINDHLNTLNDEYEIWPGDYQLEKKYPD